MSSKPSQPSDVANFRRCDRRSCRHLYTEGETRWVRDPEYPEGRIGTCPKCGHDVYTIPKRINRPQKA